MSLEDDIIVVHARESFGVVRVGHVSTFSSHRYTCLLSPRGEADKAAREDFEKVKAFGHSHFFCADRLETWSRPLSPLTPYSLTEGIKFNHLHLTSLLENILIRPYTLLPYLRIF